MTTITGITAARAAEIEAASVVSGSVADGVLTLTTYGGTDIIAGTTAGAIGETGGVMMFAGPTAPTGWLFCDGSSQLRSAYPALFAVIGTTWGSVDGTHFTLPDMRGRTPIGVGTGSGLTARALGATVGEETHLLTATESGEPGHNHAQAAHSHTNILGGGGGAITTASVTASLGAYGTSQQGGSATATNTAAPAASAASPHNNMQPSAAMNFIIKT